MKISVENVLRNVIRVIFWGLYVLSICITVFWVYAGIRLGILSDSECNILPSGFVIISGVLLVVIIISFWKEMIRGGYMVLTLVLSIVECFIFSITMMFDCAKTNETANAVSIDTAVVDAVSVDTVIYNMVISDTAIDTFIVNTVVVDDVKMIDEAVGGEALVDTAIRKR